MYVSLITIPHPRMLILMTPKLGPTHNQDSYTHKFVDTTVLPAKSDSDFMFCLQSSQGL